MKMNTRKILWALLAVTLILSFSGIQLRMANESKNKAVTTVLDYREFEKTANLSNRNMDNILEKFKASGVNTIAVKETTLKSMADNGEVYILSFADFSTMTRTYAPEVWAAAQTVVGSTRISPTNLTVMADDPVIAAFLSNRLASRFTPDEIINFSANGSSYFIINAGLNPINVAADSSDKKKSISSELDARLGFDETTLRKLKARGFNIVLRPGNNMGSNTKYLDEYEQIIKDYNVKNIIFDGMEVSGSPDHLQAMENLVRKYHLIVGITETSVQLKYIPQKGLDELMETTGYSVNRVYSSTNDEFVDNVDERYYRWVRGVIDRGIRILYVVPFKDTKVSYAENLDNTLEMVDKFQETIAAKGFAIDQSLPPLSGENPGSFHRFMVSLSLLLGGMLYFIYLFKPGRRLIIILLALGTLACAALNLLLNADFSKVYALTAAVLYPSFSSLLLLIYLRQNQDRPFPLQLLASLAIILGINMLGAYTVVTSLADIRYIMNVEVFSGVKVAFIAPLLLFMVNYFCCLPESGKLTDNILKNLNKQPSYLILILIMVGGLGLYYYLGRSGHTAGVEVSSLEIRLREVLESIFLARPRFKEIIIGYPALFAMVYLYQKYKQEAILLVLGLGVVMGSISMVNSFCHVFTSVMISVNRTLGGLLTGTIIGMILLALIFTAEQLFNRYYKERI